MAICKDSFPMFLYRSFGKLFLSLGKVSVGYEKEFLVVA